MAPLKSPTRDRAEEFIETVTRLLTSKDDLIYQVVSDVKRPNVISPSTAGSYDAIIEITFYNVSDIKAVYEPRYWFRLGEIGADFDIYEHHRTPSIEIHKRFD